jgi:hypothetical protein
MGSVDDFSWNDHITIHRLIIQLFQPIQWFIYPIRVDKIDGRSRLGNYEKEAPVIFTRNNRFDDAICVARKIWKNAMQDRFKRFSILMGDFDMGRNRASPTFRIYTSFHFNLNHNEESSVDLYSIIASVSVMAGLQFKIQLISQSLEFIYITN